MSALAEFLEEQADLDLQLSRRALYVSQEAWEGPPRSVAAASASVGWFGSDAHKETGAVALAAIDGSLSESVGDIVRVTRRGTARRSILVYVIGRADAEVDLLLSRRAFQELAILPNESINAFVESMT